MVHRRLRRQPRHVFAFRQRGRRVHRGGGAVLLYVATPIVILAPHGGWHARDETIFATTVRRALSRWSRPVSFADFFLADVACSLAKSFSDVERAVCSMVAGAVMAASDEDSACGSHSWRIPVALAAPSVVRLLQCLRQRADTGDETQTWNAIKYASAFPVIALSYAKYSVSHEAWEGLYRPAWIACAVANTAYDSYYWGVKHDWDLRMFDRCGRVAGSNPDDASQVGEERRAHAGWLRQNLLYGDPGVYYFALATNFVPARAGRTNSRRTSAQREGRCSSAPRWRSRAGSSGVCSGLRRRTSGRRGWDACRDERGRGERDGSD